MAWQEIAALAIVGLTAGMFAWRLVRPRGLGRKSGLACHCAGASPASLPTIIYKARKGGPVQILVRTTSP